MSRSGSAPTATNEEQSHQQQFQQLIKRWDESKNDPAHFDPTDTLVEMADILEKVCGNLLPFWMILANVLFFLQTGDVYLTKDPDPYDERHPSRIDSNCPLGQILKLFFKNGQNM